MRFLIYIVFSIIFLIGISEVQESFEEISTKVNQDNEFQNILELTEDDMVDYYVGREYFEDTHISYVATGITIKNMKIIPTTSLVVEVNAHQNGRINLIIPKNVWHASEKNCVPAKSQILVDGEEILHRYDKSEKKLGKYKQRYTEHISYSDRWISVDLLEGAHYVQINGPKTIIEEVGLPFEYGKDCVEKEMLGLNPPKKQMNFGLAPPFIKCKEGFDLIYKKSSSSPACVRNSSTETLLMRGWSYDYYVRHSYPMISEEYTPPYVEHWIWIPTDYNEFLIQCHENNSCPTVFEDKKCGSGYFVIANKDYSRNPPETWHFVTENTEKPKSLITDRQFCK